MLPRCAVVAVGLEREGCEEGMKGQAAKLQTDVS